MRTKRNLSVSARLSDFLVYSCSSKSLTILCSCILSFAMSSPSFRILFQSFFFLMSLAKDLFIKFCFMFDLSVLKNRAY